MLQVIIIILLEAPIVSEKLVDFAKYQHKKSAFMIFLKQNREIFLCIVMTKA
jgi:hypothetical protein